MGSSNMKAKYDSSDSEGESSNSEALVEAGRKPATNILYGTICAWLGLIPNIVRYLKIIPMANNYITCEETTDALGQCAISDKEIKPGIDLANISDITCEETTDALGQCAISDKETSDAAIRHGVSLPTARVVLNVQKVKEIEQQLDNDEIISLIYLVLEESKEIEIHLQMIVMLLRGGNRNILSQWAEYHSHRSNNWENKLVEALCIIKNYSILKSLGYEKSSVINHFLPKNTQSLHISKIRKVLYLICDNFNLEETNTFLHYARELFKKRRTEFDEYGIDNLEVYFLKWESIKQLNVIEIKCILKTMQQDRACEWLSSAIQEIVPETPVKTIRQHTSNESVNSDILRGELFASCEHSQQARKISAGSSVFVDNEPRPVSSVNHINRNLHSRSSESPLIDNNFLDFQHNLKVHLDKNVEQTNDYAVDPNRPGIVLVINQEKFFTEISPKYQHLLPANKDYKLKTREGTNEDKEYLKRVFKSFGFKVIIENNLTHIDMVEAITRAVNQVTDESSLFVCIMTHGDNGVVYGSNSCRVEVSKIEELMCTSNKQLSNKPKFLILQSCQGPDCQKEISSKDGENSSMETDGPSLNPRDLLTFWATVPGFAAIRNKMTGSWFIQSLCKNLELYGNELHFADICTKVSGDIHRLTWMKKEEKRIMTPLFRSTFGKRFFLPQLIPSRTMN